MVSLILEEVTGDRYGDGRHLPLRLGRQTNSGPAGEGIGLVITDMTDRFTADEVTHTGQGHQSPARGRLLPVERRRPAVLVGRDPAVGEPELGPLVAAVVDERAVLIIRHEAVA